MNFTESPKFCFFGAYPNSKNLGVAALSFSAMIGMKERIPGAMLTVFDVGKGRRAGSYSHGKLAFDYTLMGAHLSRRYYRRDNLWNIRVSGWLNGLCNPAVKAISNAQAILDISGGDSFTDMYGSHRFAWKTLTKLISLEQKRPLILMPQTYGPFESMRSRKIATYIVRNAAAAWARDDISFSNMRDLLGDAYDQERHHSGVDLAFSLPKRKPIKPIPKIIEHWFCGEHKKETIGFNISGLIYNDPDVSRNRYGLIADYRVVVTEFLRRILKETDVNILLIPHVLSQKGKVESDHDANIAVNKALSGIDDTRLVVVPPNYDAFEMKWIISRCNWFCGTRMHSTIAGLSTGVPTAAIAYSIKTQGVFETCGQTGHVMDPRCSSTEDIIDGIYSSFKQRQETKRDLDVKLKCVIKRAELQMDRIVATCMGQSIYQVRRDNSNDPEK